MTNQNKFPEKVEFARKLHGHIGPYLVLGLKMGDAAIKALNINDIERLHLRSMVYVPLNPPFSCLLDGIQVSTTCTVGNQRLQIKNAKTIRATFFTHETAKKAKITLTQQLSERLLQKQKQNQLDEQFAWEIAETPEDKLFNITLE
jgi:formylmethanofuran dehydrogenase subunit E